MLLYGTLQRTGGPENPDHPFGATVLEVVFQGTPALGARFAFADLSRDPNPAGPSGSTSQVVSGHFEEDEVRGAHAFVFRTRSKSEYRLVIDPEKSKSAIAGNLLDMIIGSPVGNA